MPYFSSRPAFLPSPGMTFWRRQSALCPATVSKTASAVGGQKCDGPSTPRRILERDNSPNTDTTEHRDPASPRACSAHSAPHVALGAQPPAAPTFLFLSQESTMIRWA